MTAAELLAVATEIAEDMIDNGHAAHVEDLGHEILLVTSRGTTAILPGTYLGLEMRFDDRPSKWMAIPTGINQMRVGRRIVEEVTGLLSA